MNGKHVIFSFVLLVSGFLVTFSYQQTKANPQVVQLTDGQLEQDYYYRKQLIEVEEKNKELREEVAAKQEAIQGKEENIGDQATLVQDYIDEKQKLQKLTGEVAVEGQGVEVELRDAAYIPSEENANQYIVHDSHVHKVINEMLASGAEAIAINGQRIYRNSYIACTGPVITVDGVQHPAPFVITAIGDPDVIEPSLNLQNGVVDQLVEDHVEVSVQVKGNVAMNAKVSNEG
ncbi:hypothetical protein N781_12685 [Pontibacillus halophilus JSM 076056 = DSM 19796]|uniref:DUF881 domain-containing protein n=1 Tax=Pontibacillus halophilus JSM 076056 = DSM 19796 TaxID=1385510 RepID=A0A0A5GMN4_9BACI|nr:DUF881 domain-containing protein [Pontibacillus halophilus]KGX93259.1 hypothetical protein N781_12685 [Pontibacillus halophilus JSM 076056 = DSM 19796]